MLETIRLLRKEYKANKATPIIWLVMTLWKSVCKLNYKHYYKAPVPWVDKTALNRKWAQKSGYVPNVAQQSVLIDLIAMYETIIIIISNSQHQISGVSLVPASSYLYFISHIGGIKSEWHKDRLYRHFKDLLFHGTLKSICIYYVDGWNLLKKMLRDNQ